MTYVATVLVVVWFAGLLLLAGWALDFTRLVYNDAAPGKNSWDAKYVSVIIFYVSVP